MAKTSHLLTKFGFQQLTLKESLLEKETHQTNISVVKPSDHPNPQFVIQIKREILERLNWEISDRVVILTNKTTQSIALSKSMKKDKNSFAISVQGYSVTVAKELKKGGIVKIGWRNSIFDKSPYTGTFDSKLELFYNTLIVKLHKEMFKFT